MGALESRRAFLPARLGFCGAAAPGGCPRANKGPLVWTLPMLKDRIIHLEPFGVSMVVEIRDQKVRVLSSSCQQQICVLKGWTGQVHNPIICIPNKITIDVTGADPVYDAITR